MNAAKTAKPIEILFFGEADSYEVEISLLDGGACIWRNLANTTERSVLVGGAGCC